MGRTYSRRHPLLNGNLGLWPGLVYHALSVLYTRHWRSGGKRPAVSGKRWVTQIPCGNDKRKGMTKISR